MELFSLRRKDFVDTFVQKIKKIFKERKFNITRKLISTNFTLYSY